MEYRGIEYQVVHSINGGKWKWSAESSADEITAKPACVMTLWLPRRMQLIAL